ncbi:hypothetical protein D3C72_1843990 [compost metagenome]
MPLRGNDGYQPDGHARGSEGGGNDGIEHGLWRRIENTQAVDLEESGSFIHGRHCVSGREGQVTAVTLGRGTLCRCAKQ